jgi:2-oxoglutarate ferredoxin oxidoreductase subunit gamma
MYFDSIIAGFGGQGVLLMGNLLAFAAMEEKKKVTYMPVYGVEMRGGTANCTVAISDKEIGSPIIHSPVTVVAMNLPSLEKFGPRVKKGGLLVINTSLVPEKEIRIKNVSCLRIPSRELAIEAGNERLSNMVILGALVEKTSVVSLKSLKKALYPALDVRYHQMIPANQKAMEKGAEFVRNS